MATTGIPHLDEVIARVPRFDTVGAMSATKLSDGLTNESYLLDADGDRFVVRIAGDHTDVLGIDRQREAAALQRASDAGIAPETVAFLLPEGHSVTRFVDGARPVTIDEARSESFIIRMARRLREIHALDPIDGEFHPYTDISRWLELADERGIPRSPRLAPVLERVERVRLDRQLALDTLVLCHNDSYHLNVLDDGELWIIDWEYAGMGDPFFDLAANAFELGPAQRELLLETYFGRVTDDLAKTLEDMIAVFLVWNVTWSMVQLHDAGADHDYVTFADRLLTLVPPKR